MNRRSSPLYLGLALSLLQAPPRAQTGAGTVKVFVLAGQSNMEGFGKLGANAGEKGTLKWVIAQEALKDSFPSLVDKDRKWLILDDKGAYKVRTDVRIYYKRGESDQLLKGGLTAGLGYNQELIGPEFGFGHVMGEFYADPVLVVKVARGGKSLNKDFLPPRDGGYGAPSKDGDPGYWYKRVVDDVKYVLGNFQTVYPELAGKQAELMGFGWHQGWNDGESEAVAKAYEGHMINFIKEIRQDLSKPALPFVIAVSGFNGFKTTGLDTWQARLANVVMPAQFAAAAKSTQAAAVDTRPFWRAGNLSPDPDAPYHWNLNAETYFLIGNGLGEAMKKLLPVPTALRAPDRRAVKLGLGKHAGYLSVDGRRRRTTSPMTSRVGESKPRRAVSSAMADKVDTQTR